MNYMRQTMAAKQPPDTILVLGLEPIPTVSGNLLALFLSTQASAISSLAHHIGPGTILHMLVCLLTQKTNDLSHPQWVVQDICRLRHEFTFGC